MLHSRRLFLVLTFCGLMAAGCAATAPVLTTSGSASSASGINTAPAMAAQTPGIDSNGGSFLSHNGSAMTDVNSAGSRKPPSTEPVGPSPSPTVSPSPSTHP